MKTIELEFKGYKREVNKSGLECKAGIYCVYAGTYDRDNETVNPQILLYIGQSSNINERIGNDTHEHFKDWKEALRPRQILMYTRAFISDSEDRDRAEAALIYHCQPPINEECRNGFHYNDTKMVITGKHAHIDSSFVVYKED